MEIPPNEKSANTGENPAPDENRDAQDHGQAGGAQQIAATVPQIPVADGAAAAPQSIFGVFKRKRGRPRKNPFTAPTVPAGQNPGTPVSPALPLAAGAPAPLSPAVPVPPADYSGYGKGITAIICGIYHVRNESKRGVFEKKLPVDFVDRALDKFAVPDFIKNDLEEGYSGAAQDAGLPPVGGNVGKIIAGHTNLEIHYRNCLRAVLSEIRKLPDLKKDNSENPVTAQE